MAIKLVAIDIDDTLLSSQKKILNSTKEVVTKALTQDVKVVLCSGRPLAGVEPFLQELGIAGDEQYVITFNGGVISTETGHVLAQNGISHDTYQAIDQYSQQTGLPYNVLDEHSHIYTSNLDVNWVTVIQAWENTAGIKIRRPDELAPEVILIKGAFVGDKEQLDEHESAVKTKFGADNYVVRAGANFLEIMHPNVNKGKGLEMLAEKLHLQPEEVMAIGDEQNDIAMFDFAGTAVAMENGSPIAKEHANYITKSNDDDGIAHAFNKYVF